MLCACVSGPDYEAPPAVAAVAEAERFANENEPEADEDAVPASGPWWAEIGGTELAALIGELNTQNLDLAAARARVEQAGAVARQARARRLPAVRASGDGGGLRLLDPPGFPWADTYSAAISASWDTDIFGRLRNADRAARLRADAALLSQNALRQSLAAEIARAYVGAFALMRQIEIAEGLSESFSETAMLSDERYRAGSQTVSALDVQISRQNAAAAAASIPNLEAQYVVRLQTIDILLGRLPGTTTLSFAEMAEAGALPAASVGEPSGVLRNRPDVAFAEASFRAALSDIGVARADLYPTITLSGVLQQASSPANVLGAETLIANLVGEVVAPLYEGGRRRAEVRRAEAAARELGAEFEQTALTAVGDVEAALAQEQASADTVALRAVSLEAARLSDAIASERYAAGRVGLLTVLETRRALDAARQDLVAADEARLNARIDLRLALGGDWFDDSERQASP
ncbi:MAG: efflux transporter outer membrane subunit [Pseudomonadota bacterium]